MGLCRNNDDGGGGGGGDGDAGENGDEARREIVAFVNPAAYTRFLRDFGWLIEAHHRYQLYNPTGRRTTRRIVATFAKCVAHSSVPAIMNMMATIIQDVKEQEAFEKQQDDNERKRMEEKRRQQQKNERISHAHPGDQGDLDDLSRNPFDKVLLPMTSEQRLVFHNSVAIIHSFCILIAISRAQQWGMQPMNVAKIQVLSTIHCVFFTVAVKARIVASWTKRQFEGKGWLPKCVVDQYDRAITLVGLLIGAKSFFFTKTRSPLSHLASRSSAGWNPSPPFKKKKKEKRYSFFICVCVCLCVCVASPGRYIQVVMTQNAAISTLFPHDDESFKTSGVGFSRKRYNRWIIAVACHASCVMLLGIFYAESAPMTARRYDLGVQAAVHVLMFYAMHLLVHGRVLISSAKGTALGCYLPKKFTCFFFPSVAAASPKKVFEFIFFYGVCARFASCPLFSGHCRYMNELAFSNPAIMTFWLWLVPVVAGTLVRSQFRVTMRRAYHESLARKLR